VRREPKSWALPPPDPLPSQLTPDARAARLWELLTAAVATDAAAPRVALSGGLDSRAVAAAAAAVGLPGLDAGTFGDPDCVDLPVAAQVAGHLGLPHRIHRLDSRAACLHADRVWRATSGRGGLASAPGADTDEAWADRGVLLSGNAGDVIWGDTARPGPSPARRLKKLGLTLPDRGDEVPPPPPWASPAGAAAWANLWTRQARVTWLGVLPRLAYTPVQLVCWHPPLLSFCLALTAEDRRGRALLRRMLAQHTTVSDAVAPPVRGPVHGIDRALRSPAGRACLASMTEEQPGREQLAAVGLRWRAVRRMVRQHSSGRRDRGAFLSRVWALWRWGGRR